MKMLESYHFFSVFTILAIKRVMSVFLAIKRVMSVGLYFTLVVADSSKLSTCESMSKKFMIFLFLFESNTKKLSGPLKRLR